MPLINSRGDLADRTVQMINALLAERYPAPLPRDPSRGADFFTECIAVEAWSSEPIPKVYDAYVRWCAEHKVLPHGKNVLGKQFHWRRSSNGVNHYDNARLL